MLERFGRDMTKEQINEFSMRISQSNKTQIVVVTFEIIINYIDSALEAMHKDKTDDFVFNVKKARQFVNQLSTSLDFRYGIAVDLMNLYLFANDCLLKSELRKQNVELEAVKKIMEKLHASFEEVSRQDTSAPVMTGGEKVYQGLTYGKNGQGNIFVSK